MQYRTTGTARTVPEPDNAYHLKNRFYRNEMSMIANTNTNENNRACELIEDNLDIPYGR